MRIVHAILPRKNASQRCPLGLICCTYPVPVAHHAVDLVAHGLVPWVHSAFALRKRRPYRSAETLRAPEVNSGGLKSTTVTPTGRRCIGLSAQKKCATSKKIPLRCQTPDVSTPHSASTLRYIATEPRYPGNFQCCASYRHADACRSPKIRI